MTLHQSNQLKKYIRTLIKVFIRSQNRLNNYHKEKGKEKILYAEKIGAGETYHELQWQDFH